MSFNPISLTIPHIAYACLGGFVVVFGMFSLFIREKLYIGEACWAFLFGVIIGPYGAGIFDPRGWANQNDEVTNTITLEFTRVVLAIGVFAIGVELPKAYVARHWKSLFFLLFPVMTWGWFVSAGLILALIPGISFLSALAVAACLTPTDPILAAAVVGGKYADKHVPAHIRHLLAAESGCNDGAAYPFLFLSLYLVLDASKGSAVRDWFLLLWLYQIVLSVGFGSLLGYGFRHLMKFCERKDLIDRQSYVAQYVSLAFLTIGIMTMLGSDDLLSAFCCGTAFAWDGFFNRQTAESVFSSVIDLLFNVAAFVYVGAWMPFDSFNNEALTLSVWRLVVIGILVLLLKRLPIMIMLYKFIPDVKTFREAMFSGHFGPIGIGAVYISTLAVGYLPKPANPPADQTEFLAAAIQPIVAFMVLCSIATHGLSIPFFSLSRRVHSVSSRTWSRHASAPDWTTHTRLVTRAEDVVINRDQPGAMENGRAGGFTDASATASKCASIITAVPQETEGTEKIKEIQMLSDVTVAEDIAKERPPDGTELTLEWREGPHKIVERRGGPGQEVEVEVIHNAYDDEKDNASSLFRGPGHVAMQMARACLHYLRQTPQHIQQDVETLGDAIHQNVSALEEQVRGVIPSATASGDDAGSPGGGGEDNGSDDDAWASDKDDREIGTPSDAGPRHESSRSTEPTAPAPSKHAGARSGKKVRRPASIGEGSTFSGYAKPTTNRPSTAPHIGWNQDDERGVRGRRDNSSASHSARRSLKHRRLESLRTDQCSREASPTRSVRFADPKSGTSSPRTPTSQND